MRKVLLHLLSTSPDETSDEDEELPQPDPRRSSAAKPDENQLSASVGDFRELNLDDNPARSGNKRSGRSKKSSAKTKSKGREETDGSTNNSSDDDQEKFPEKNAEHVPSPDGEDAFALLYAKFRQVIRQGGPGFAEFLSPLTLEVTTKTELYQVLEYYRAGVQCARTLCFQNNLPLSHKECKDLFQVRQLPIVLPELRSHPQATFPLAERVAPTEIRRFLQAGSIIAYTRGLADKAGSANKDSADGYLAREILTTGLALVNVFDEFHPYQLVFSNAVERLVGRLVVHDAALALDRKERGAFYEKNLAYLGLGAVASGKSLNNSVKRLSFNSRFSLSPTKLGGSRQVNRTA